MDDALQSSFHQDGFLAFTAADVAAVRAPHANWFALLTRCNQLGMKLLAAIKMPAGSPAKVIQAAMYYRTLQSFQAGVLLAERGMLADARSALRACAETVIMYERLSEDATFVEQMGENADYYRRSLSIMLLTNPRTRGLFSQDDFAAIQREVAEIEKKYAPRLPKKIVLANELKAPQAASIYNMVYRQMSLDAAHPSLQALTRHILESERLMYFGPQESDMVNTLVGLIQVISFFMASVGQSFDLPGDEIADELGAIREEYDRLNAVSGEATKTPPPSA